MIDPTTAAFRDPVGAGFSTLKAYTGATQIIGSVPEALGDEVRVVEDAELDLWLDVVAGEDWLGFGGSEVGVLPDDGGAAPGAGEIGVTDGHRVRFSAAAEGDFQPTFAAAPLDPVTTLIRVPASDVATLDLVVMVLPEWIQSDVEGEVVAIAVARDAEGRRVLAPPVQWGWPDGFRPMTPGWEWSETYAEYAPRPDVIGPDWHGKEDSNATGAVTATLGALAASASLAVDVYADEYDVEKESNQSAGCATAPAGATLVGWALAGFVAIARRRRSGRDAA